MDDEHGIQKEILAELSRRGIKAKLTEFGSLGHGAWMATATVKPGTVNDCRKKAIDFDHVLFKGEVHSVTLSFGARKPRMVPAKLGDWVLVYNDFHDMDKWHVGKVTSVRRHGKDKPLYGIRHFCPRYSSLDRMRPVFKVSSENYSGYRSGVVKILTQSEALDIIERQVNEEVKKDMEHLREDLANLRRDVLWASEGFKHVYTREELMTDTLKEHD